MRLGDMLLKANVVTEAQLTAAIAEQQRWGGKLGQVLVRMGALSEELLVMALSRQLQIPRANLDAIAALPDTLKAHVSRQTCERYRVLPLAYVADKRTMQLAMSDPFDVVALDDLTRELGTKIEPFIVGDNALAGAIRRLYDATSAKGLTAQEAFSVVDNAGAARSATPMAAGPGASVTVAPFAARVDEHVRTLRAVSELLMARGIIRPDELKR